SPSGDRLVAVGYVGLGGDWRPRAWTSTDGIHWALASIDEVAGSFAVSVAVAPDGSFIAVGRSGSAAAAWWSIDGSSWVRSPVTSLGSPAPQDAERMRTVVATAQGLFAGGSGGPELQAGHR